MGEEPTAMSDDSLLERLLYRAEDSSVEYKAEQYVAQNEPSHWPRLRVPADSAALMASNPTDTKRTGTAFIKAPRLITGGILPSPC